MAVSWNILRGVSGDFEIGRVWLSIGGFFGVTSPIGFEIWEMGWKGGHFDVAAWCLAYPGGLAALVAGGVLAIGSKEKAVATAQVTKAVADSAQAGVQP